MHHLLHVISKKNSRIAASPPPKTHYMFNEISLKFTSNYTCNECGAETSASFPVYINSLKMEVTLSGWLSISHFNKPIKGGFGRSQTFPESSLSFTCVIDDEKLVLMFSFPHKVWMWVQVFFTVRTPTSFSCCLSLSSVLPPLMHHPPVPTSTNVE